MCAESVGMIMMSDVYAVPDSHYCLVFMFQSLLDMMIQEEESLKKRLINSIQACRTEMETLYLELQLPTFEVKAMKIIQLSPWQHGPVSFKLLLFTS